MACRRTLQTDRATSERGRILAHKKIPRRLAGEFTGKSLLIRGRLNFSLPLV